MSDFMKVSVDAGKGDVKIKIGGERFKFENKVHQSEESKKPSNPRSYEVTIDGQRYLVGDKVAALKDLTSNKIISSNRITIYTAIANAMAAVDKTSAEIQLTTGLPNLHYTADNEDSLIEMIACEDKEVTVDGKTYTFSISAENMLILPENYSYGYKDIPRTLTLDIGFRNVNHNVLEYGMFEQEHMRHCENGVVIMKKEIADQLESLYNENLGTENITDYIVVNGLPHHSDSKKAIDEGIVTYFKELSNVLEASGVKMKTINQIVIRGGGTNLFNLDHLKEVYPEHYETKNIVIEGDEYANVEIFSQAAEQYFR